MSLPTTCDKYRAFRLIDSTAFRHNVTSFQNILGSTKIMAVVKANAYGHGATIISPILESMGIDCFATATLDEAIALRKAGITSRIIILQYVDPCTVDTIKSYGLTITLVDEDHANKWIAMHAGIDCVLAIDTGMHRLGIPWFNQDIICRMIQSKAIHVVHIYSHLADAESLSDSAIKMTRLQQSRFDQVVELVKTIDPMVTTSLQATYGVLNHPDMHYDYARIGVGLYGIQYVQTTLSLDLKPILSLYGHIESIHMVKANESIGYCQLDKADHDRTIATVSFGYVDGLTKAMRGHDLYIDGKAYPIVGNICMDCCMIDISGSNIHTNQWVEVIGSHQSVIQCCDGLTTHFLEFFCSISDRVPIILA